MYNINIYKCIKLKNQIRTSSRLYQYAQCPARRYRAAGIGDFSRTPFIPPAVVPPPSGPTGLEFFRFPSIYPSVPNLLRDLGWLVRIIILIELPMRMNNVLVPELGPLLPLRVHSQSDRRISSPLFLKRQDQLISICITK